MSLSMRITWMGRKGRNVGARYQLYTEKQAGVGLKQYGRGFPLGSGWTKLEDALTQLNELSKEAGGFGTVRIVDTITGKVVAKRP
jgi:hypothetical protein